MRVIPKIYFLCVKNDQQGKGSKNAMLNAPPPNQQPIGPFEHVLVLNSNVNDTQGFMLSQVQGQIPNTF